MSGTKIAMSVISEIRTSLEKGISELKRVGELYVKAITKDPEMKQAIQNAIPELSPSTWARFERLGRGLAVAQLMYDDSQPARRLIKCPVSEQEKYLKGTFTLLLDNGDTLQVSLHSLTKEQTDQLFNGDHVRDLAEQKAWLTQRKRQQKSNIDFETTHPAYEIVKSRVRFRKDVELTRKEIADILAKIS